MIAMGCNACGGALAAQDFYSLAKRECKPCARQRMRDVRAGKRKGRTPAHPTAAAKAKAWREANPERAREASRRASLAYRARRRGALVESVDPARVLVLSEGRCGICGEDVDPARFDVDHVVPLSRGGAHSYENVQAAHPRCNYRKGARLDALLQ